MLSRTGARAIFLSLFFTSLVSSASFDAETDAETARLQNNRQALTERQIDLLPVPKHIAFIDPVMPEKVAIVISEQAPRRAVIIEELSTRFQELGLELAPLVVSQPATGMYNIIIRDWNSENTEAAKIPFNKNPRFDQAYTLTPIKNGIELCGRKDALYAAITMRYLITAKQGKALIHPAAVADWPDFHGRTTNTYSQYLLEYADGDPEKYMERVKPLIRLLLHHKINQAHGLVRNPYKPNDVGRLNPMGTERQLQNARLAADYAAERGMQIGALYGNFRLGSSSEREVGDRDSKLPEFQQMMHYKVHKAYTSWGRLDMHGDKGKKFADYISRVKTGHYNVHAVDTGGSWDPEMWSQRDELTKKMFGDDRGAADIAVFKAYFDAVKDPDVILSVSQYPYSSYILDPEGGRIDMGLPDTLENRTLALDLATKHTEYLKQLDRGLSRRILFCAREGTTRDISLFFDAVPQRAFVLSWYTFESALDIGSLAEPDIATVRGGFRKDRETPDVLKNYSIAGCELGAPAYALWAEYSWNSAYPGCHELEREKRPLFADASILDIVAERASSGFFGEQAGPTLKPLFDNMFSFYLTVDPAKMAVSKRGKFNLLETMRKNHTQLLKAETAFDSVWSKVKAEPSLKQTFFKPGSYIYFLEYYRMIKAAKVFSTANLAAMEIESAAAQGDLTETESIHHKAKEEIAAYKEAHQAKLSELENEPQRLTLKQSYGWFHQSPGRMTSRLLGSDFTLPEAELESKWANREKIFENSYAPRWFKQMRSRSLPISIPIEGKSTLRSWCSTAGVPAPRKIELELSRNSSGILLAGKVWNNKLDSIPVNPKAGVWAKGQDVFECFFSPDGDEGKYYQFAFNQDGTRVALEHIRTRVVDKEIDIPYELETARGDGLWSFSMKIPFAIIGQPSDKMKGLFCAGSSYTGKVADKSDFHDRKNWNQLYFVKTPPSLPLHITLDLGTIKVADKTHSSGSGSAVTLHPEFSCTLPVDNAKLLVRILGMDENPLSPWQTVTERNFVPCAMRGPDEIEIQLENKQTKFIVELKGECEYDGERHSIAEKFVWGENIQRTGAFPFDIDGSLNPMRGGISFDYIPETDTWKGYNGPHTLAWLFHAGVQSANWGRPPWRNLISFVADRRWGIIYLNICDNDYKLRRVSFNLPKNWQAGQKLHIDCEWDMRSDPVKMSVHVNGELVSGKVSSWEGPDSSPSKLRDIQYNVRIGSVNNGSMPSGGTFSDIKLK